MTPRVRAIQKALTWRVVATTCTAAVALMATGSLGAAGAIAVLDAAIKLVLYYYHERAWQRVPAEWRKTDRDTTSEQTADLPKVRDLALVRRDGCP